jgi:hypothetical protein
MGQQVRAKPTAAMEQKDLLGQRSGVRPVRRSVTFSNQRKVRS